MSLKARNEAKNPSASPYMDASMREEKKSVMGDLELFRAYQAAHFRAQPVLKKDEESNRQAIEEIKQKIKDLENEEKSLRDKLYPPTTLTVDEQQKAWNQREMISVQIRALRELLAQKLVITS